MQTFKRIAYVIGILLLIFVALVAWKYPEQKVRQAKLDFEVSSPEENLVKHEPKISEDRAVIEQETFFRGSRGEKDAGPYLNTIVHWDGHGPSKIQLPKEVSDNLRDKNWVAYEPDFKALKLDFAWMEKLTEFDYWASDDNNPHIKPSEHPVFQTLSFPGYMELTNWAKLRLIHGRKTQTMPKALAEVRQLARLIYTNDYLVSAMVAIAILRHEGKFVQNYNPKIFAGWKTVPEETLVRAKRYFWAMPELVDPRLSDETHQRFSGITVGKCQMISEGVFKNIIIRDHLQKMYPGAVKRFDEMVKSSLETCRKSLVHVMWNDTQWKVFGDRPEYAKSLVKPENESEMKWKLLMISPRIEEYFALTMLTISSPNYLKEYQELEPKAE
ncbi:MAG: hypothetical protein V4598_16440 [Bdellovibrionota bacterium]